MTQTLFMTGAGGFLGSAVREHLVQRGWTVRGLVRTAPSSIFAGNCVVGDLLKPETYRGALVGADAVLHLAAVTGKAPPREHWRVNREGTRVLMAACKEAGVKNVLHVSTIAAGYPNLHRHPYAESKLAAEALVRESGLAFTIVRPTIVLGVDSPIWVTLKRFARSSRIPLPEGTRPVLVQPIHVREVARAIDVLLSEWRFEGETLDLGGADPEWFADFLQAVRSATTGRRAQIVRLPLAPLRLALELLEPIARPLLPVSASQMTLFGHDSTANSNWLMERLRPQLPTLRAMFADLVEPIAASAARPPSAGDISTLEIESAVFARYLTDAMPSGAAVRHYVAAAKAHGVAREASLSSFERASLALARRGPLATRCADAFCVWFDRRGALRRKLILFTAIIENQSPTNEVFDAPQALGPMGALLVLTRCGVGFAIAFLAGALALAPAKILSPRRA